jgi:phage baseplate assembly protein W
MLTWIGTLKQFGVAGETAGKIKAYIVDEIEKWEPRAKVKEVRLDRRLERTKIQLVLAIEDVEGLVSQELWI